MADYKPHILIIPFPAQGHMLSLLDLAHHLSAHNLTITIAVTTANRPLLTPLLELSPSITPLVLPFPSNTSIPAGIENTQHLPPGAFPTMIHVLGGLHHPLKSWSETQQSPPTAIISDMFLGWTLNLAKQLNITRLVFSPSGALTMSISTCLWRDNPSMSTDPVTFKKLPNSPTYYWRHLSSIYRYRKAGDPMWDFITDGFLNNISSTGWVINSCDALEGNYLTHMKADFGHENVWGVGPLCSPDASTERGGPSSVLISDIVSFLDMFDDGSLLYVCFGSQAVLTPPQAAALGAALERSGVRFVWCVKKDAFVPEGFEERVSGRGMVVRGWAPQVAVLRHKAVGWFLTHCGWNSTLEAVTAGVAMLTWPMTADQFMNARLLVEEVGVGVKALEGEETVPDVEKLASILKEAVGVDRPERMKAEELKKAAAEAVAEGGSSYNNLKDLVQFLSSSKI